ncbi:hypothetical protein RJ55_00274 [Drechmeria coniospora]|nr:hypothetical protein RJ55_00274 [Drechmeria coniospora]
MASTDCASDRDFEQKTLHGKKVAMPRRLQPILGKSNRVRKAAPSSSRRKTSKAAEDDGILFPEKLDDVGLTKFLADEVTLRDVIQAMRYVRSHMFTPVPPTGFTSTRTAELLNYRASTPAVVTAGHLNAVLDSPTRTEREVVELVGKGALRKVRVERRSGMGEALIETSALEDMIRTSAGVSDVTAGRFLAFLKANPSEQMLARGQLTNAETDELVRAGFLTSAGHATPGSRLLVRPEDRTTLTSIQHVSRFASGTVSAVGGQNAIHLAGGGGGRGVASSSSASASASTASTSFRIAVPGHGRYLKLAEGAVNWLREALGKTAWGEGTEDWLRERFEGGGLYGARWKEFWGLDWSWLIGEAVGLGIVELFDTGCVGRGVRALGG